MHLNSNWRRREGISQSSQGFLSSDAVLALPIPLFTDAPTPPCELLSPAFPSPCSLSFSFSFLSVHALSSSPTPADTLAQPSQNLTVCASKLFKEFAMAVSLHFVDFDSVFEEEGGSARAKKRIMRRSVGTKDDREREGCVDFDENL
jgi:hypothetical protein